MTKISKNITIEKVRCLFGLTMIAVLSFIFIGCEADSSTNWSTNSPVQNSSSSLVFENFLKTGQKNIRITGDLSVSDLYSTANLPVLTKTNAVNLITEQTQAASAAAFTRVTSSLPLRYSFHYRTCRVNKSNNDGIAVLVGKNPDQYSNLIGALPLENQGVVYANQGLSLHLATSGRIVLRDGLGNILIERLGEQIDTDCQIWQKIKIRIQSGKRELRDSQVLIVLRGETIILEHPLTEQQVSEIERQPLGFSAFSLANGASYQVANIQQTVLRVEPSIAQHALRRYTSYRYPIPQRVEDLFVFTHDNQASSDRVMLAIQGGPSPILTHGLPENRSAVEPGLLEPSYYSMLDEGFSIVNVHQINTLHSEFINAFAGFTPEDFAFITEKSIQQQQILVQLNRTQDPVEQIQLFQKQQEIFQEIEEFLEQKSAEGREQANRYVPSIIGGEVSLQNAEILARVIRYFHARNKKVYLYGGSYGAYLVQFTLLQYPEIINSLEKVLIAAGRLKIEDDILAIHRQEMDVVYRYNSNTEQIEYSPNSFGGGGGGDLLTSIRLLYPLVRFDYTKELAKLRLPKNKVCYMVADRDLNVGVLSEEEKDFAKDNFQFTQLIMQDEQGFMQGALHTSFVFQEAVDVVVDFYLERNEQCNPNNEDKTVLVTEPTWEGWMPSPRD